MNCKKCDSEGRVTLRKKDYYCHTCFITNTNHKFRACIGKHRLFTYNENVLVCLSGGAGSTVLLDLINCGVSLENHKKLRIKPVFLHLSNGDNELAETVITQCNKYGFNVHIAHISDGIGSTNNYLEMNALPKCNPEANNFLYSMAKSLSPTVYNDFLAKMKRTFYIQYAKQLHCKFIFTAETTTSLASNLLSSIAIGRGNQVESDIGFIDNRDEGVKILRPMKDISKEELHYYINIKELSPRCHSDVQKNSLQLLINSFVSDLQDNFSSTISTVCKTAAKLGTVTDDDRIQKYDKCKICESYLNTTDTNLTALKATEFSRLVSLKIPLDNNRYILERLQENQTDNNPMFPHIDKHLCYSCSRNCSEVNERVLAQYIDNLIKD